MSYTDWVLLGLFIAGFLLFLYGANTYNAIIGYSGIYLFIGSIAAYLVTLHLQGNNQEKACLKPIQSAVFFV